MCSSLPSRQSGTPSQVNMSSIHALSLHWNIPLGHRGNNGITSVEVVVVVAFEMAELVPAMVQKH